MQHRRFKSVLSRKINDNNNGITHLVTNTQGLSFQVKNNEPKLQDDPFLSPLPETFDVKQQFKTENPSYTGNDGLETAIQSTSNTMVGGATKDLYASSMQNRNMSVGKKLMKAVNDGNSLDQSSQVQIFDQENSRKLSLELSDDNVMLPGSKRSQVFQKSRPMTTENRRMYKAKDNECIEYLGQNNPQGSYQHFNTNYSINNQSLGKSFQRIKASIHR